MGAGFCIPSSEIAEGTPAAAYAGPCYLIGVLLISDGGGANDPGVILYDDPDSAHGTVLAELGFDIGVLGRDSDPFFPTKPIRCDNGIWVVVSGTNATAIVYYEERG